MSLWQRYQPAKDSPWDRRRAIHLHRRAVFGATWDEIQRDLQNSPEAAVNRVLHGECRRDGIPGDFASMSDLIGQSAAASPNPDRLKAWWIYRCLFSPHPLQERLTFMWHNHFATSNLKVDSLPQMKRQNEALRKHAFSRFDELLTSMLHDPAMLIWLDAAANHTGHSNENLGRELMELFTVGIGNYSETDVKETARALTGLTIEEGEYHFEPRKHDDGEKTILNQSANFDPESLSELLLNHPAISRRLAWRLTQEFFGEGILNDAAVNELAAQLEKSKLDISQAVETILHSQLFFSAANLNSRICDPLSFLLIPLRGLQFFEKPPSTLILADWLRKMGLDLFYPPNVGGWKGGRNWLNTRTVIARTNYVAALVQGTVNRPVHPPDLAAFADKHLRTHQLRPFADFVGDALRGGVESREIETSLRQIREFRNDGLSEQARIVIELLSQPKAHLH